MVILLASSNLQSRNGVCVTRSERVNKAILYTYIHASYVYKKSKHWNSVSMTNVFHHEYVTLESQKLLSKWDDTKTVQSINGH